MPHLVVSISAHGFGHIAQTAPVLNALHARCPGLRLTVRSAALPAQLRSRIRAPFEQLAGTGDIGMMMSSAVDVRVGESHAAYRIRHADWDARVTHEARLLRDLNADLVFSNVDYLPLAGAQRAGLPNAALCSLNWADIYRHYCGNDAIAAQMRECYAGADAFLCATPCMAMDDLPNRVPVSPIADTGTNRRAALARQLDLPPQQKLVLISMGGIADRVAVERWPRIAGVTWLVQQSWQVSRPDSISIESLPVDFADLFASSDVLICKPGYGSFVEAACSGVPVLYVQRPDWPEAPVLIDWLAQHGLCREVARVTLEQGKIANVLEDIWHAPRPEPVISTGAEQVADWLAGRMGLVKQQNITGTKTSSQRS